MESYGFEMVCDSFSLPRIILKVPVDKIWTETKNFDYKRALDKLKENIPYEKLVKEIVEYLEWIEEKMDFKEYFRVFNFTFSEKEIFKKLYYKLKAKKPVFVLWHGDWKLKENYIDEFLRNWKKLDKKDSKEFLQNLQKILW
jgi:hypothetical protein